MKTLALALLLTSCSVHPFVITDKSGRHWASLGGSLGTKSISESSSITLADGTTLSHTSQGKDEVKALQIIGNTALAGKSAGLVKELGNAIKK